METQLQFRISSGLKNLIGRELITDDFIAIFELVKNSYDAHATKVVIEFENLKTSDAIIRITDNGKGMSYDDLVNKWLFVAYSAKKDGTEDLDYRNRIHNKTFYAGAKGIGRFSCDKLGSKLKLITTKDEEHTQTQQITVDWGNFEQDAKAEFINIGVSHSILLKHPSEFDSGTILEISGIRNDSNWSYEKIGKLRSSLSKLINPFEGNDERLFEIEIKAVEFKDLDDRQELEYQKINGKVRNNLLGILNEKTIKIRSTISEDGKSIETEIFDNGTWLFSVFEENDQFKFLKDVFVELYFLNRSAKNNFTRIMGIRNTEYGSVFLYKNKIRVYPYGEPGSDPLELDKRQQKRIGDRLGTQQLIGRIEIVGENEDFKETTSRDGGLIKNQAYFLMLSFLISVIEKLEFYWLSVYKYGVSIDESIQDAHLEERIIKSILRLNIHETKAQIIFNEDFVKLISSTQRENESAFTLINQIESIAIATRNQELVNKVRKIKSALDDALTIAQIAEQEIKEKDIEIKEKEAQNLFLKSIKSKDLSELVSLMHHIGISSGIISIHLQMLAYQIDQKISISDDELKRRVSILGLENQKILSISRFATKANFKFNAETQRLDLVEFICQYLSNVAQGYLSGVEIQIDNVDNTSFVTTFKPLELTMIIDNLINNAKKANATKIFVNIIRSNGDLLVYFKDNGIGIPKSNRNKIFDFGFTTTSGSGLGLTHVKETLENIGAKIMLDENDKDFTSFLLTFKK